MEKFEISDSKLEHNNWRFPKEIKTRPLRDLDEDDFLVNHKASFSMFTVAFVLTVLGRLIEATMIALSGLSYCTPNDLHMQCTATYYAICRVGNAVSANLENTTKLPIRDDLLKIVKHEGWVSDDYEHLWRRDSGGSAALTSHAILSRLHQQAVSQ